MVRLTLEEGRKLAFDCLIRNGCDEANAAASADRMIQTEGDGCASHGLFRLGWYVKGLKTGRVNGAAQPRVERLAPGVIRIDGDNGFAPLGQRVMHEALVALARENGIAAAGFVNMFHIAALWPEVEALADDGLVGFAFTPSYPYVAPAGGTKPLYGTNPVGFAWPRDGAPPLVFDQASSAMARGEIMIAARDGHSVPDTAGIGPDGEATTDPNMVLQGAQLGFGGYKGAALALMVELIAGPLIGDFLSIEAAKDDAGGGGPPKGGELVLALDPKQFGDPDGALLHGEKLFAEIAAQEGTRLPGERRFENRKRIAREGFEVPQVLYDEILGLMG